MIFCSINGLKTVKRICEELALRVKQAIVILKREDVRALTWTLGLLQNWCRTTRNAEDASIGMLFGYLHYE